MEKQITKKNWHIVTKKELLKMPWASENKVSHKPDAWDADAWIDEANEAKEEGIELTGIKYIPCDRCDGKGIIDQYYYICNGRCFKCDGKGRL